jgi:hypothetical protein
MARSKRAEKSARVSCLRGCGKGQRGAAFCTQCGSALPPVTGKSGRPAIIFKAAVPSRPIETHPLAADLYDVDPGVREATWQHVYGPLVTKSR